MSNPLKLGKLANYFDRECIYCGKIGTTKSGNFKTCWLCTSCENKLKYKIKDLIWFVHYSRALDKLEILCGTIIGIDLRRISTYRVEYHKFDEPFKKCDVPEQYIFSSRDDALEYANKITVVADDTEVKDLVLMQNQDKVYKQIKQFLESESAITFGITGIDVTVENGYVNAQWKFGERKVGDLNGYK